MILATQTWVVLKKGGRNDTLNIYQVQKLAQNQLPADARRDPQDEMLKVIDQSSQVEDRINKNVLPSETFLLV